LIDYAMQIIIDTREQTPWGFPVELATTKRGTLPAGDYALDGDYGFAVERKSLHDFIGTVVREWDRFNRELERMAHFPARVIIVEASFHNIIHHEYDAQVIPALIIKRVAQLTMMGVAVLFVDDPISAAGLCWKILDERAKAIGEDEGNSPEGDKT
jgi:ERCC4-type nuclease